MQNKPSKVLRVPQYPHFDEKLSHASARSLVESPYAVSVHPFFPLLSRKKEYVRFRKGTRPPEGWPRKTRTICYAAKRDSVIYRHYREILFAKYEPRLEKEGLTKAVLAYREVRSEDGRGKSNLHFAKDAFDHIAAMQNCVVFCFDIEKFFENLDHRHLYRTWAELLGVEPLPADHFAVLKAATKYRSIDEKMAFRKLGLFGAKTTANGRVVEGFLKHRTEFKTPLCDVTSFRTQIAPLVRKNDRGRGVAQGLPISDVLANMSMIGFDDEVNSFARSFGGFYFRYSDDILLALPTSAVSNDRVIEFIRNSLTRAGQFLKLKDSKTAIHEVIQDALGSQRITTLSTNRNDGAIDYLGLHFDGAKVSLRDSTLSRLRRRIVYRIRRASRALVEKHPNVDVQTLMGLLDIQGIMRSFGRVDSKSRHSREKGLHCKFRGNFRSYAVRAGRVFADDREFILSQLGSQKQFIRKQAEKQLRAEVRRAKS